MKWRLTSGAWEPAAPGWGLVDVDTRQSVDPPALVTDEKIEMTPWDVHGTAVQFVRMHLAEKGYEVTSWQNCPEVNPSLWFVGDSKQLEWVVVRCARYPAGRPGPPANLEKIADRSEKLGKIGHFASLALASAEQPLAARDEPAVPLWRGHGMRVIFGGLVRCIDRQA